MWFVWILVQIALTYAQMRLRPKNRSKGPGEVQTPIAEEGYPIPRLHGTTLVRGPLVVWTGNSKATKEGPGLFAYGQNMQMILCYGIAKLISIRFGDVNLGAGSILATPDGKLVPRYTNMKELTRGKYNYSASPDFVGQLAFVHRCTYTTWSGVNRIDRTLPGYVVIARSLGDTNVNSGSWIHLSEWDSVLGALVQRADGAYFKFETADGSPADWVASDNNSTGPSGQSLHAVYHKDDSGSEISGTISFFSGTMTQDPDDQLKIEQRSGGLTPSYPDICYAVFRDEGVPKAPRLGFPFRWGYSTSFPAVSFELQCIVDPLGLGSKAMVAPKVSTFLQITAFVTFPPSSGILNSKYFIVGANATGPFKDRTDCITWFENGAWKFQLPVVGYYVSMADGSGIWKYTGVTQQGGSKWGTVTEVGVDANPANILYDYLTHVDCGLGLSTALIDFDSFVQAGNTLYDEGIGMTVLLDKQDSFDKFAEDLQQTVDGVLYQDPITGLLTFDLVRDDYDLDAMLDAHGRPILTFTESDYEGRPERKRISWQDVNNQVQVQYIDRLAGYSQRVVREQDPANRIQQGELVSLQNVYNSINSEATARLLARRDSNVLSQALERVTLKLNGRAALLHKGSVFLLTDSELGLANMPMRVLEIEEGTLEDPYYTVDCTEDVFGTPQTVYVPPSNGYIDPTRIPASAPAVLDAFEVPYPLMSDLGSGEQRAVMALAARPDSSTNELGIYTADDAGTLFKTGRVFGDLEDGFTPSGQISADLVVEERTTSITVQGTTDFSRSLFTQQTASSFANLLVVDEEWMQFDSVVDNGDGTWSFSGISRGVLDTIPAAHAVGTRLWWIVDRNTATGSAIAMDATVTAAATGSNALGETNPYSAPQKTLTTSSRQWRPYVGGKFRLGDATDLPSSLTNRLAFGDQVVSWKNRNRLTQGGAISQDADTVAPEAAATNRVRMLSALPKSFALRALDGTLFPLGVQTDIGAAGSNASWATVDGGYFYAATVGMTTLGTATIVSQASGSYYVFLDPATGITCGALTDAAADLYSCTFQEYGGRRYVTVTDARGWQTSGPWETRTTGETATLTADVVPYGLATVPGRIVLDAVLPASGDLASWSERNTGMLYPAGYGQGYGLLYGGN